MKTDRIEFISEYCDRWCERCAYTSRCAAYAVEIATAMCGDLAEGLELAVGRPHPVDGEPHPETPDWLAEANDELTAEECAEFEAAERARDARVDATALSVMAWAYTRDAHAWLRKHRDELRASSDEVLAEALDVVSYDSTFITMKLHRALSGRDRYQHGDSLDEDPMQGARNGSAKTALMSLERSEAAWRVIGQATVEDAVTWLIDAVRDLHEAALDEFPCAMSFVRPGFDEPWR
jgi:hypothetical protein